MSVYRFYGEFDGFKGILNIVFLSPAVNLLSGLFSALNLI